MGQIDYFFPGKAADAGPLTRYGQPIPTDVIAAYIAAYTREGETVLDPFCLTGTTVHEAAKAGRRVIAISFDPIGVLTARVALNPPPVRELDAAMARLGNALKLGAPLREHLNQLYSTTCPHCQQQVIADYFVWDREAGKPVEKGYYCPTSATERLEAVDQSDLEASTRVERHGFHYWYILERLAPAMDESRALARKLLELYTPRNLYALANLLIKIETLFPDPPLQEALRLILLRCLDLCSSLYASSDDKLSPHKRTKSSDVERGDSLSEEQTPPRKPSPRFASKPPMRLWWQVVSRGEGLRPQRLRPPPKFIELNVWQAFESAYQEVRQLSPHPDDALARLKGFAPRASPEGFSPEGLSPRGRIFPYGRASASEVRLAKSFKEMAEPDLPSETREGMPNALVARVSARQLAKRLPSEAISLIIANPPRLDRLSSSLSYLWSGWLFGRKAAAALRPLLRRRPAGWSWYLKAMRSTFQSLYSLLHPQGHLVLFVTTEELAHCDALILAAIGAGLKLESILYQPSEIAAPKEPLVGTKGEYRFCFVKDVVTPPPSPTDGRKETANSRHHGHSSDVESLAAEIEEQALKAAHEVLRQRGEPLVFNWLHNAIYQRLGSEGLLQEAMAIGDEKIAPIDFITERITTALKRGLTEDLVGFEKGEEAHLPLLWWLKQPGFPPEPLGDRMEQAVHQALSDAPSLSPRAIYPLFPGLLTPEVGWVEECLASYGEEGPPGHWRLRREDQREQRESERTQMMARLVELGRRLGFQVWVGSHQQERPYGDGKLGDILRPEERLFDAGPLSLADVIWHERGQASHVFIVQWVATLKGILLVNRAVEGLGGAAPDLTPIILIPEERAALVRFKAERSPLFQRAIAEGDWKFIKYPSLCHIIREAEVDRHDLKRIIGLEPIIEKPRAQLPLF